VKKKSHWSNELTKSKVISINLATIHEYEIKLFGKKERSIIIDKKFLIILDSA
jgi:hypothetical protein